MVIRVFGLGGLCAWSTVDWLGAEIRWIKPNASVVGEVHVVVTHLGCAHAAKRAYGK